jgi:hypothetical protein
MRCMHASTHLLLPHTQVFSLAMRKLGRHAGLQEVMGGSLAGGWGTGAWYQPMLYPPDYTCH